MGLGRRMLVALLAAVAMTGSGPLPAVAQPSAMTTVRGTVTVDGVPAAGVPVGTWSPSRGILSSGTTDAAGAFVLRSPAAVPVDAFAGRSPRTLHAVFALGEHRLVRGAIGATAPAGLATALRQRVEPVVPARLGGSRPLRFRLQEAGRFTAAAPDGGTGRAALRHDGFDGPWFRARDGLITSRWLVPGEYRLQWEPIAPHLPVLSTVRITPGATTQVAPPVLPLGTTVRLRGRSAGAPLPAGVPAIEYRDGVQASLPPTDGTGTTTVLAAAPGTHRYAIGRASDTSDEGRAGRTTSDDFLPATVTVRIAPGQRDAEATVDLAPASEVTGSVTAAGRRTTRVVAQDADGDAVRTASPDAAGAFTLGGLAAGRYTVVAEDLDRHVYDRATVVVGAGTTAALPRPLQPATPDPVVRGAVRDADVRGVRSLVVGLAARIDGIVLAGDRETFEDSTRYRLQVPPGRYTAEVWADGRQTAVGPRLVVAGSLRRDLRPGPAWARVTARFVVGGRAVPPVVGAMSQHGELITLSSRAAGRKQPGARATPGRYRWTRSYSLPPALDGPWTWTVPAGGFVLRSGRSTDLGTLRVGIRG